MGGERQGREARKVGRGRVLELGHPRPAAHGCMLWEARDTAYPPNSSVPLHAEAPDLI